MSKKEWEAQELSRVKKWFLEKEWCLGLALSGSRAWKWSEGIVPEKEEDFDFFVIVRSGWLWQARAETIFWAWRNGRKRRRDEKNGRKGWCFNLWLTENGLLLPEEKQNWFSLGELFQLRWLVNKEKVKERLIKENWTWIQREEEWAAGALLGERDCGDNALIMRKKIRKVNDWCFFWQNLYMGRRRKGAEIINREQAFFHPVSRETGKEEEDALNLEERAKRNKIREKMKKRIKFLEGEEAVLPQSVSELIKKAKANGQLVILATGVFDLLHEGHREFLERAKDCGEVLVVGLESDRRARELKGADRPAWKETERFLAVAKLPMVDGVVILPDDFSEPKKRKQVMRAIDPDLLAVSPKTLHLLDKKKMMQELGGDLAVIRTKIAQEVSTTKRLATQRAVIKSRQKSTSES